MVESSLATRLREMSSLSLKNQPVPYTPTFFVDHTFTEALASTEEDLLAYRIVDSGQGKTFPFLWDQGWFLHKSEIATKPGPT